MVTNIPTVLLTILVGVLLLWLVAFVVYHATEIVKGLSYLASKVPAFSKVQISGYASYVTALILSIVAVFYPGSGIATPLGNIFTQLGFPADPIFVQVLTTILVSLIASAQHDSGKLPSPLRNSKP